MIEIISVPVERQGLHDITHQVAQLLDEAAWGEGLCTLFVQHTSASLLIQENYDATARHDLEAWLNRLVPENDALYTHTLEGADDMPAHIKAALTATNLAIPIIDNKLALGTWQGLFLWEHRKSGGRRKIIVHLGP
ncbi:MAG: YjbQ family protein [Gammaproteobacteria bacterium]|nr:MAG: YjbQ family protein [Gammaproteobacteria bacterium]RLA45584.1 MAG: YjbQ family protein [Gammaproteobacteria bacterium]